MVVKSQIAGPGTETWVDAAPFRAHVRFLMAEADVSGPVVAALARVQPRAVERLLTGAGERPMRRLSPVVACRLFAVTPGLLRQSRIAEVPAAPVGAALRRLRASGWSLDALAGVLRTEVTTVDDLMGGAVGACPLLLALRVQSVPSLVGVRPASATPAARAA